MKTPLSYEDSVTFQFSMAPMRVSRVIPVISTSSMLLLLLVFAMPSARAQLAIKWEFTDGAVAPTANTGPAGIGSDLSRKAQSTFLPLITTAGSAASPAPLSGGQGAQAPGSTGTYFEVTLNQGVLLTSISVGFSPSSTGPVPIDLSQVVAKTSADGFTSAHAFVATPLANSWSLLQSGFLTINSSAALTVRIYPPTSGVIHHIDDLALGYELPATPALSIASVTPTAGSVGATVTISGTGFDAGSTTVYFNGYSAPATVNAAGTQIVT